MQSEITPWGSWEILYEDTACKIKKLVIKPQQQTSLQFHYKRQEHWVCTEGYVQVILDRNEGTLVTGESMSIPYHAVHQILNPSEDQDAVIMEIQIGEYFGEDDIVRISDPYNRDE